MPWAALHFFPFGKHPGPVLKSDSFSTYLLQFPILPFIFRDLQAVFMLCQRVEAKVKFQFITQMFPNSM